MAGYRKLGRTSSQRKALLRNQVTDLLYYGKIITTEAKAKEIRKIAEGRKDKDGKRVKEVVDGKKVTVYDNVEKEIKKDQPSRLHARRQMQKTLYKITEVPADAQGRKSGTKTVDVSNIVLDELGPKYAERNGNGGYTRIVKIGQRKGDAAMQVLIELV